MLGDVRVGRITVDGGDPFSTGGASGGAGDTGDMFAHMPLGPLGCYGIETVQTEFPGGSGNPSLYSYPCKPGVMGGPDLPGVRSPQGTGAFWPPGVIGVSGIQGSTASTSRSSSGVVPWVIGLLILWAILHR